MKIVLASQSPRRKELLETIVKDFEIISSNFDESSIKISAPNALVKSLAEHKGEFVYSSLEGERCVISADTIVCYGKQILGKPKNKENAKEMLKMLSNTCHKVITGVCVLINKDDCETKITFSTTSNVYFKELTEQEIEEYVNSGEPMDKAGAYAIQGLAGKFVKKISGSFHNIVGLPTEQLYEVLLQEEIL